MNHVIEWAKNKQEKKKEEKKVYMCHVISYGVKPVTVQGIFKKFSKFSVLEDFRERDSMVGIFYQHPS